MIIALASQFLTYLLWGQPGEGPNRGLLRDYEIFVYLWITFVSSSSSNVYHVESLPGREQDIRQFSEEPPVDDEEGQQGRVEEVEAQEDGAVPQEAVRDAHAVTWVASSQCKFCAMV